MRLLLRALPIIIILTVLSFSMFSQVLPPPPDIDCNPKLDPFCIPITDHIGWLVALMVGFGIVKTIQYSKKSVNA